MGRYHTCILGRPHLLGAEYQERLDRCASRNVVVLNPQHTFNSRTPSICINLIAPPMSIALMQD